MLNMLFGKRPKLITADKAKQMLDSDNDTVLVDLRDREEYEFYGIERSVNLPYDELNAGIGDVIADKDKKIILTCEVGKKSAEAAKTLIKKGYANVYDMGGIYLWKYGFYHKK